MDVGGEDVSGRRRVRRPDGLRRRHRRRRPSCATRRRPSRRAALFGQALLWVVALVAASRLRLPALDARAGAARGDRRAVIDLDEDVDLPTDAGDVPVMVPLEPVGAARAGQPARDAGRPRPLFRADDEAATGGLGRRDVRRRGREA